MSKILPPASLPAFSPRSHLAPAARRILSRLQGPLSDSVFILRNQEREPYVVALGPAGNSGLHPIAQASLTEPKVGSITVHVDVLRRWQEEWLERHERHAHADDKDCVFVQLPDKELYELSGSKSSGDDGDGEMELLRCCDTDRPKKAQPLVINASDTYVTVHDYLSALHPWLMGLRDDIVRADNVCEDKAPDDYRKLVVDFILPNSLKILDERRFLRQVGMVQMPEPVDKELEDFLREVCRPGEPEEPNYQYMFIPEQPSQSLVLDRSNQSRTL
ncbi:hypothetical protein CGLO_08313 [Colletotrichum gloeosporioides Cg-14]|uniref:Uncharacterized protein n=1 Tax=Colletotrichum gloeosporioides (strain Cg-14) TaxID=1237896 RepID=T0LUV8_COLGC|nr:hypothetical protein CGLO_08313 [Colletotrichum gloeosporioides Cg-14]